MNHYTTKQFQIMTDVGLAWDLMTDAWGPDEYNCSAAPFFEYAVSSSWLNKDYLYLDRFWLEGDQAAAFVFYEQPVSKIHFILRPGHEALADEMIRYAEEAFPEQEGQKTFVLNQKQTVLREAAEKRGYHPKDDETWRMFDFRTGKLEYPLPDGFHFVPHRDSDPLKIAKCLWDGFNSEELGPFQDWDVVTHNDGRSPYELYHNVLKCGLAPSPHATYEDEVIIANAEGEYVCYSGMWWVEKNKLAYMEPLCTVPAYQRKGLAAAALSEHDRRLRPRGAVLMTGGGNEFYRKIGFGTEVHELYYMK